MKRHSFRLFFIASLVLLDMGGLTIAFEAAYWTRFFSPLFLIYFPAVKGIPDIALYHQALWALLPTCAMVFFYVGFYKDVVNSAYDEFILVLRGATLCALLAMALTFAYGGAEYSRLTVALWAVFSVIILYVLRELNHALFRRLLFWLSGPEKVLVIGKGKALEAIRQMTNHQPFVRVQFLESVPDEDSFEKEVHHKHISEVLLLQGSVSAQTILDVAQRCENLNIACKIVPDLLEMRRGEIIVDGFCGLPTFSIKSLSLYGTNYALKRSFDILCSLAVLTISAIPLIIISLLITLDSRGPIFYSQDRMGFHGRKFKLYKFRTMIVDADSHMEKLKHLSDRPGPVFKMKNDPRITRVGRWLRRFSLDELPQIFNVLKGDMSLVGPRPQVLWEAAAYDDHAKKRLRIKPGITGLWQVSGRAALSYEEMINLDIFYLENWSLGLDLKILIRTLPAVFAKEGAY
jgi:exopolysaccharide biosynthesis polyprenyl glycosylphosphotransferase